MRLYDRIMSDGVSVPPRVVSNIGRESAESLAGFCLDRMEAAVRFDIQNVGDYMLEAESRNPTKRWDWTSDFPNVALPYDSVWFEYRHPAGNHIGVLASNAVEGGFDTFEFTIHNGEAVGPFRYLQVSIGDHGGMNQPPREVYLVDSKLRDTSDFATEVVPVFMALTFLHCKNVSEAMAPFIGPRQQRRALERKGIKQAQFKTLVVEPMKQVLKAEGGIETNGLKKALHICRGHFATYSEDRPLFGRYSGTFWKPAHVRGNAENGTVYKDYKVKAPKA